MGDNFLYDKLLTLNNVYHNSIVQGKTPPKASVIKTQLYPHQSTLVNGMHIYRDKMTRGFLIGNQAINGKLGIIGDKAGTGKTLSILAYLASQIGTFPRITCELSNNSSKYFFSHEIYQLSDASSTNLIIVPHSLFNQWKNEIEKHTTMTYVPVETKRVLKDAVLANTMVNANFVITTNKCYKSVQDYANQYGIQWNNIIIDEASSIYISSSDPPLRFQFLWLVTNNWIPLLFKNPSISKSTLYHLKDRVNIHPDLEKWLVDNNMLHYEGTLASSAFLKDYLPFFHENRGLIVLRNLDNVINNSIKLPSYTEQILNCRANIKLNSLISYYLARNLEPNINSDKIPKLFQALNIECKSVEEYINLQPSNKHNLIMRKVQETECMICFDKLEYPTIVNCCNNIFCAKCLLKNTIINHKCPTCRDILETENIYCLKTLTEEEKILCKSKTELCLDILKNSQNGKFLIYSSFDNIYYQLFEDIDKLGLKAERIDNGLFSQLKTLKNFNEGKIDVLFVSNVDLIRGFSLETISHLIFYHELPVYELKQVLIHSAQRIGRKNPLQIIQLNSEIQF